MPYYEIVFETGSHSTAYYESDEEANSALEAQNSRALAGELGGPAGNPAERVTKVFVYDNHPADYGSTLSIPAEQLHDVLDSYTEENIDLAKLQGDLWDSVDAVAKNVGPHESWYKAPETKELELEFHERG